jgi:hypothetical protein
LVGRMLVGRMLVGRMLVGRMLVGRMLVGRMLVGRMLVGPISSPNIKAQLLQSINTSRAILYLEIVHNNTLRSLTFDYPCDCPAHVRVDEWE